MLNIKDLLHVPRLKKVLAGILIFLVVFSITGFFVLPPIIKSVLIKQLSEKLHREVTIGKIAVNPFMLSLKVSGVIITDRDASKKFLSFEELYVNFQSMSLLKMGPIIAEVRIEKPFVNIIRNEDEKYNFSDLLPEEKPKPAGPPSRPFKFSVNNIQIRNGSIDFWDGPKHTAHTVRDMHISIPFFSNLPYYLETYVQPSFEAKINDRAFGLKGRTKPFADSLETVFDIDIKNLDIPHYLAYVPFPMDFKVPSCFLDAKASVSYVRYRSKDPAVVLSGDVGFREIRVTDKKDALLVGLPSVDISIAPSELITKKIHLAKVLVQSPELNLVREGHDRMNLQALLPRDQKEKQEKAGGEETGVLLLEADQIMVSDGKLSFVDAVTEKNFRTTLEEIQVKVDHFSTAREKKSGISLSLRTEAKETVSLNGDFSVEPLASEGTFEAGKVALKKYAPYFPKGMLFGVEEASLDLATKYVFVKDEKNPVTRLAGMSATVSSLRLKKYDEKEDFLDIPVIGVRDADIDLDKKEVAVGELTTRKGVVTVKRYEDGKLNLLTLFPAAPAPSGMTAGRKTGPSGKPWRITMKKVLVDQYTVKAEDLTFSTPFTYTTDRIQLKGENISNAKNSKGKASLSMTAEKGGTITAGGTIGLDPPAASLKLDMKKIDIVPFQPYFTEKINIFLSDGDIFADGTLTAGYSGEKGLQATYKGEASLSHFSSVDKANADDFLKWDSLYFSGMDVSYNPLAITISDVSLTDFYSRFIINADGTLNLQDIFVKGSETQARPEEAGPKPEVSEAGQKPQDAPRMVKIEKVTLQGGTVNFSDRHIKPNFSANMLEIGGRISGMSSEENIMADVDLRGKMDNYAPLMITGKINPLREDLFVDLKIDFKDMDLSPVTPYSSRYLGYTIQKGKLSLYLQYLIVKKKLDAENKVFLDQFTLGEQVESPEATKLPVRLAIALLKNRKGEISLDIPVSGQIDDPKFSLGRIIIKILLNLLVKAATSPFALLGALFGGGEELSYLEFDPGSALISAEGAKKLDTLGKALYDRPSLKLDIEGFVDADKDREGLRQYIFNKKIRAQKLKAMVKKGLPPAAVDDVVVEQGEYAQYLKLAYKEEKFPKPRNIIGIAKDIPVPEMEKLMFAHIEVKDDDLRQLASQRAMKVKDFLLGEKKVEPDRVFLVEPKSSVPVKKDKVRDSRVEFRLK